MNKKKFMAFLAVVAIVAVAALNMNINSNKRLSNVSLSNIEALALSEDNCEKNEALYTCGSSCLCCGPGNVRCCSEGERCN